MTRILLLGSPALIGPILGWLWWELAANASHAWHVAVLAAALVIGFGAYFATSRQPDLLGLKIGVIALLAAVSLATVVHASAADLLAGRVGIGNIGPWLASRQGGWDTLFTLLGPIPAFLLIAIQTPDLVIATAGLSHHLPRKRRRRARSDLYGRSRLMGSRDRRRLERSRGLLLGQRRASARSPLVAWPLEGSAITLAPPRTGKGATIALNLLSPGDRGPSGSTIVIDPRGETYCIVARRRRRMGRNVLLLDPFHLIAAHKASFEEIRLPEDHRVETYNPLDFIRDGDAEAVRDIGVLLDALLTPPSNEHQNTTQHFYQSAREIIAGLIAWVRFREPEELRTLARVKELAAMNREALEIWKQELETRDDYPGFAGGLTMTALNRRLSVGPEEAGSQASTVANQLSFLTQPDMLKACEASTFDPAVLSEGETDLFVVVPDDMVGEVRSWVRLWITIPNAIPNRAALKRDLLLVIDEMPRLGFLKPVMDAYNLAAGKGVHFWCFAQSLSALESTWGREATRTLIDLAEVIQVLGFPRADAKGAKDFAEAIGHATFESSSESRSGTVSDQGRMMASSQTQVSESTQLVREYLVSPDDLMTMGPDEQYVIAAGKEVSRDALHIHHARYWLRDDARHLADPNPFVLRKATGGLTAPHSPPPPVAATSEGSAA